MANLMHSFRGHPKRMRAGWSDIGESGIPRLVGFTNVLSETLPPLGAATTVVSSMSTSDRLLLAEPYFRFDSGSRRKTTPCMVNGGRYANKISSRNRSKLAMSLRADTFAHLSDNRQCHRPHRYRLLQSHPRDTTCMIGHAGAVKLLLLVQTVWPAQSREPCKVRDGMDHPCLPETPGPLLSSHWLNRGGTDRTCRHLGFQVSLP